MLVRRTLFLISAPLFVLMIGGLSSSAEAETTRLTIIACENLAPYIDGDEGDATTPADEQSACVSSLPPTGTISIASVEVALGNGDGALTWEELAPVSFLDRNRISSSCTYDAVMVQLTKAAAGCTLLVLGFVDDEAPVTLDLESGLTTIEAAGATTDFVCDTDGTLLGHDADCSDVVLASNGDGVVVFRVLTAGASDQEERTVRVMQEAVEQLEVLTISSETRNDPNLVLDPDDDGVLTDDGDNCPYDANSNQLNTDADPFATIGIGPADITRPNSDALGDACDFDADGDGSANWIEEFRGPCNIGNPTSAVLVDTDGDRAADLAECSFFSNPASSASKPLVPSAEEDPDVDGLPSWLEGSLSSNPNDADTDDDGIGDGVEFMGYNTSPTNVDTDGDGCPDGLEISSLDMNEAVNSMDLLIVALSFNSTTRPNMDIDKSGIVNSGDLLIVALNYDRACGLPD